MSVDNPTSADNAKAIADLKAKQETHEAVCIERHKTINDKLDRGEQKFDMLDAKIESKFKIALLGYFGLIAFLAAEAFSVLFRGG